MDDATTERLSRYLDGDLTPDEDRALVAEIAEDPRLEKRLRALEDLRGSLRGLAADAQAPPELDRVIEPLLRSAPPPTVGVRPWVRWLATAAALVLGVTVIMEINRQGVGPKMTEDRASRPVKVAAEPTERFALAPLPTTSLPLEEQPVGVGDRLIASPIPEMVFDDPPALEVLGPLDTAPSEREKRRRSDDRTTTTEPRTESDVLSSSSGLRSSAQLRPEAPTIVRMDNVAVPPSGTRTVVVPDSMEAGKSLEGPGVTAGGRTTQAQFFLFDESRTVWRDFEPSARCKHGRYALRVRIEEGFVVEVWPVGAATSPAPQERLCAAGLATGLEVADVVDGEYHAEVVIEPRRTGGP